MIHNSDDHEQWISVNDLGQRAIDSDHAEWAPKAAASGSGTPPPQSPCTNSPLTPTRRGRWPGPDGTHLLTTSNNGTVRVWEATSRLPVGFTIVILPGGEIVVFDAIAGQLVRASAGAWRWLDWNVVEDGRLTRLPAESFGTLPLLHPAVRSAKST